MPLILSGSIDISGSIAAQTITIPGGGGIVSSSTQIQNYNLFAQTSSANIFYNYQAISGSKFELHTSDANGGIVVNSKATTSQAFMTFLDRGTNDNNTVGTFVNVNGTNQLGGLAIVGHRKDNQSGLVLRGQDKVSNSGAVNGYVTAIIGNAYSDNALTTLTTGVTGKSISFLGQDTELANLNFNGDLSINNGNLVVASGRGIDFSAASNAAGMTSELLNDYEEGTWTPTVTVVGTTGTVNYIDRVGRYTKIGRLVNVEYAITGCSLTGSSGYIKITGLPFTINSTNSPYQPFAAYGNLNFPSSSILYQQGGTGDTVIYPQVLNNSGFYADFTQANLNSGGKFTVSAGYVFTT